MDSLTSEQGRAIMGTMRYKFGNFNFGNHSFICEQFEFTITNRHVGRWELSIHIHEVDLLIVKCLVNKPGDILDQYLGLDGVWVKHLTRVIRRMYDEETHRENEIARVENQKIANALLEEQDDYNAKKLKAEALFK